jgi:hypothetical protein
MKHIHFFGCSFTAGDELSDEIFFPWKKNVNSLEDYYIRRNNEFSFNKFSVDDYINSNLKKAYPSKLQQMLSNIICHNHAKNGSSLKEQIFRMIKLVISGEINNDSQIFLQIPPHPREMILNRNFESSIQFNLLENKKETSMSRYINSKLKLFDVVFQTSVDDFTDLLMLKNYMIVKNIPLTLLTLGPEVDLRKSDINSWSFDKQFLNEINKELNFLDLSFSIRNGNNNTLLGGHLNENAHLIVANIIKDQILSI